MHDVRPLYKRGKFVAFALVGLMFTLCLVANIISPGAVQADVQSILAGAIAVGLPSFQIAQGLVDKAHAEQGQSPKGVA